MFDYQKVGSSATKQEASWNNHKAFTSVDPLIGYIVQSAQPFFASGFLDLASTISIQECQAYAA
jgi:hypothetical protein